MEPSVINLIVAALAVWEILEIWHHSTLFAGWRARIELWDNLLGDLLRCMFCMSPWTSLAVLLLLGWLDWPGRCYTQMVAWAFATARLANLGNDVFHGFCRTPREEDSYPDMRDHA